MFNTKHSLNWHTVVEVEACRWAGAKAVIVTFRDGGIACTVFLVGPGGMFIPVY
jgi:hypothetical protein